eukprot:15202847-Alexandrium_andersonii.AAC.1
MQSRSTRSNLELRGPRNGLRAAPRSSPEADKAPEAPSRSCLFKQLPKIGSCLNEQLPNSGSRLRPFAQ